jgi:hypothetical protein
MARPEMGELEKKSIRFTVRFRPEEINELETQAEMTA